MSDVVSMADMMAKMKMKELKEYSNAQFLLIGTLRKENLELKEKLEHMEHGLLKKAATLPSDEELICVEQISILKNRSDQRELSLDEVKRLDLLIKNLRLLREQSTQVIESVDYTNMKEADLVAAITSSTENSK